MNDPGECRQVRPALGVYLLGATGPAERAAVERHLAGCDGCREELAGLAGLPGRLGSVSAADVVMLAADTAADPGRAGPGDARTRTLLRRAARMRRRRMRRRVATAGVAAALAAGALLAGTRTERAAPPVAVRWPETVRGSDPVSGAWVIVRYRGRPWGTQIAVRVSRIPAGTRCELRVVTAAGQQATAGSWTVAAYRGAAWYPASAPFPEAGVRRFMVVSAGRPLVSVQAK